jgi:serine/threonine protein kinase
MTSLREKRYIGGYRVIAPIGAGGFATVYRAVDEETDRQVAIKVLAENHSLVADTRRRFTAEIELLRTVESQTIARVYEVGETSTGQPYMVLELADRGDLRRRLEEIRRNHQVLSRAELALLAHHLYESLTTLHRAEIIHRDVSPGNILIRSHRDGRTAAPRSDSETVPLLEPGERFLLADLGHAKDMIRASGFTAGGGTQGFASPEQRDDITVVDLRADIFSATAVIEWAAHDGAFADQLEPFYDVGLATDPDDRFTSMTEWHAAFSAALSAGEDGRRGPVAAIGSLAGAARSRIARLEGPPSRPLAAAGAVVGAGLIVLLAAGFAGNGGPERRTTVAGVTAEANGDTSIEQLQSDPVLVVPDRGDERPPLSVSQGSTGDANGSPGGSNGTATDLTTTITEASTSSTSSVASAAPEDSTNPDAPSKTETSEPAPTTTTTIRTTTAAEPSVTTSGSTGSSQPATEQSTTRRAEIDRPANGTPLRGENLTITGTITDTGEGTDTGAGSGEGTDRPGLVQLSVLNASTDQFWSDSSQSFGDEPIRFAVPVDASPEGTWRYTVPAAALEAGIYLISVWADDATVASNDNHSVFVLS